MINILINLEKKRGYYITWTFVQDKRTNVITIKRCNRIISVINSDHEFSDIEAKKCIAREIRKYGDYSQKRKY